MLDGMAAGYHTDIKIHKRGELFRDSRCISLKFI